MGKEYSQLKDEYNKMLRGFEETLKERDEARYWARQFFGRAISAEVKNAELLRKLEMLNCADIGTKH